MRIKNIIAAITLVAVLSAQIFVYLPREINRVQSNLTQYDLVLNEFDKLEYEQLSDIEHFFRENKANLTIDQINNLVFTIEEDNLEEWLFELAYNYRYDSIETDDMWFVYDLALNNEYCYKRMAIENICYISEDKFKISHAALFNETTKYGMGIIYTNDLESIVYPSAKSELMLESISNAYIIAQGPKTDGYDEAMKWSRDVALSNKYIISEDFDSDYYQNLKQYERELSSLNDNDLEGVETHAGFRGSQYREVLDFISEELGLPMFKSKSAY